MLLTPFNYDPSHSIEVLEKTTEFLKRNAIDQEISQLGWAYYSVGDVIPQTTDNFWSGHFFPWSESWDELQISFNLCLLGFYKQAMVSLRSSLELGLLSVYWNLNDDGHLAVQEWLNSSNDTPRYDKIWKHLTNHPNFAYFQSKCDVKDRILNLSFLHNFVHTKGFKFSNAVGLHKSSFQTFEETAFNEWYVAFREVIVVLCILHLIKYPLGVIEFDYESKFGIDIPSFGGLRSHQVEMLRNAIDSKSFETLLDLATIDPHVKDIIEGISSLPDLTPEQMTSQIDDFDKIRIKHGGFEAWLTGENNTLQRIKASNPDIDISEYEIEHEKRIADLKKWAKDEGLFK